MKKLLLYLFLVTLGVAQTTRVVDTNNLPSWPVGSTNIPISVDSYGRVVASGGGGGGTGTVTSVSVTTANGVSGSVATATTTPAITLTLGAITPLSVASTGAVSGTSFTDSGLTSGRVPFVSTGGLLADASTFAYNSGTGVLSVSSVSTTGSVSSGVGGTDAGALELGQGTAPSTGTTSVKLFAPTSVTSYTMELEGAVGSTGVYIGTVSGSKVTLSRVAPGTSGNVLTSNGTTWTSATPASGGETVITPSTITGGGDTANYSPTGLSTATVIRIAGDANLNQISGIAAQTSNKRLRLWNIGANTMILRDQLAGLSTAANRFANGGSDLPLFPGGTVDIQYDDTSAIWRPVAPSSRVIPPLGKGIYVAYTYPATLGASTFFNMAGSNNGTGSGTGTLAATALGGVVDQYLETGTTTTGKAMIQGNNGYNVMLGATFYWRLNMHYRINPASNGTDTYTLRLGFSDAADGSSDATDGVYVRYTDGTNSGNWVLVLRNNSTESTTNCSAGPTFSATAYNDLAIIVSPTKVEVWQNGVNIGSTTTLTNLPTARATDVAYAIAKSAGTTSVILYENGTELIAYRATPTQ